MSFFIAREPLESDTSLSDPAALIDVTGAELEAKSSSLIRFYPKCCTCFDTRALRYPNETATWRDKISYLFQCPPIGPLPRILSFLIIFFLGWGILYLLLGGWAGIHGPIFALVVLEISGLFSGIGLRYFGFPALLAPLALGIVIRNIDFLDRMIFKNFGYPYTTIEECSKNVPSWEIVNSSSEEYCCNTYRVSATSTWIDPIREIALTLILTRAGVELSPKQLKKLKGIVPALAFGPCLIEALTCASLFAVFFAELEPNIWMCLVSGFALAAVSPAVVVPGAMSLKKRGYGVAKGIPTLLIASSSIDDVLAITLYTICLNSGVTQSSAGGHIRFPCKTEEHSGINVPHYLGIVASISSIPLGVIHGIIIGCVLHFIPSKDSPSKGILRLVLLIFINVTTMLIYERTGIFSGAGSIGVLVTSFVASYGWRSQKRWKVPFHTVEHNLGHIWTLFVPILFGTIGKEIRLIEETNDPYKLHLVTEREKELERKFWNPFNAYCIARILVTLFICLIIRTIAAILITKMTNFNWKERLFIGIAWLPKATVQAALAPIVLSKVLTESKTIEMMCTAKIIVTLAVVGIIISAPIGAIAIATTGKYLLTRTNSAEIEEEFPNGDERPESQEIATQIDADGASILENEEFINMDDSPRKSLSVKLSHTDSINN